jgi:hypothetical protein
MMEELDELERSIHPLLHLDTSKRTPSKLRTLKSAHHKLQLMVDILAEQHHSSESHPLTEVDARVYGLYIQLWHVLHPHAKDPRLYGPTWKYHHLTDFQNMGVQERSEHFTNLAHLQRRIGDQRTSKETSKSPVQDYALKPTYRFVRGMRLFKEPGVIDENEDSLGHDAVQSGGDQEAEEMDVELLVSKMRVRILDAMLVAEVYKKVEIKKLADEMLKLDAEKESGRCGSSKCHGHVKTYPVQAVARRIYEEFQL